MPKVQVDLPEDVHGAVRVEAALRKLTLADTVAELCREAVMGPLADGAPPVVGVELEERPKADTPETVAVKAKAAARLRAEVEKVAGPVWAPRGLSKADQAARGKGKGKS